MPDTITLAFPPEPPSCPPEQPEVGALFVRASASRTELLTRFQSDAIEGLLDILRADDWKAGFICHMLQSYHYGQRESPFDVLHGLQDAEDQFSMQLEGARAIATDYRELLNPDVEPTRTSTRRKIEAPKSPKKGNRRPPTGR